MKSFNSSLIKRAVILFAPLIAYITAVLCGAPNLSNLFSALGALAAAVFLLIAFYKADRPAKAGVLLYALGCFSWTAADVIWALIFAMGGDPSGNIFALLLYTFTNIFFLTAQLLFILGRLKKWDRMQTAVDITANAFLSFVVIWLIFFRRDALLLTAFLRTDITGGIALFTDVLIGIGIYTFFLSIRSGKVPFFLKTIFFGLLAYSYIDIIYYYLEFTGLYYPNTLIDVLYVTAIALIAFGALYRGSAHNSGTGYELLSNTGVRNKWIYLLIYPAFVTACALAVPVRFKLKLTDFLMWIFIIAAYRAACGYIQHSHNKESMLESALSESERSRAVLMSNLPGMAYRCDFDRNWTMRSVSEGCISLTGYAPESFLNNKDLAFKDIITPKYHEPLWREWGRILERKLPFKYEYEITTACGEKKWVLEMGEGIYGNNGEVLALEGIILDISDRKRTEEDLRYIGEHDMWTGLYNLRYLEGLLVEDAVKNAQEKRAVVCVNLNALHALSLIYGFYYSRELIKKLAATLQTYCSDSISLFNIHEYKFAFYIKGYQDKCELAAFCEDIGEALESAPMIDRTGAGIGIVEIHGENAYDVDRILKNFLIASEKANATDPEKGYGCCFYDTDTEAEIVREEAVRRELALICAGENDKNLFLRFQPIFDLKSERITGFEALARLTNTSYGKIPPLEFIPIAEKTMLIIPLGQQILERALLFLQKLKENGFNNISVAVNISALQMLRTDFANDLLDMIEHFGIDPSSVELEITESVFASDFQAMNRILAVLRERGLSIAIDDFGTGYSSFARENELNVSCLKIDKYFIDKIMKLSEQESVTGDIISIGHKLGHTVTAEGVEHEKQLRYLRTHGCDKVQGFLISKPLSEEDALLFLREKLNQNNIYSD